MPEGKDVDYFTMFQENTLERLIDRANNPGLRGVGETGFDILDTITGGYQDGQLISIVAVPKTGKSTLALYSALHVRSVGRRAMFFTFEMSAAEQEDRLVSMVSGVDYNAILDGTITQREIDIIAREHKLREYSHEGLHSWPTPARSPRSAPSRRRSASTSLGSCSWTAPTSWTTRRARRRAPARR